MNPRPLAFLTLLWSSAALGQETSNTPQGVLVTPADSVLGLPDGSEEDLNEPSLILPLDAPALSLSAGITKLPTGSHVVILGDDGSRTPHVLPGKYWLLPDSYYREAVTKAKQLDIYQPALERCTETSLAWQERTYEALDRCSDQFDTDETLIDEQVQTIATLEAQVTALTYQRDDARRQRNAAWAVTGGLVLGAATVITVAVAP